MAKRPTKPTKAQKSHPLYLDPLGKMNDFSFGVLRSSFSGRANSVLDYADTKLRLCTRSEVLLPPDAHDGLLAPTGLWRSYESAMLPGQRDLATCVTIYLPDARTLHSAYEEVRSFARQALVAEHGLPVMVVLHAPGLAGSAHDPHAHLVIAARQLRSWGWGAFSALVRDEAQRELFDAWTAHRKAWAAS